MNWLLSALGTLLALIMLWLYGNQDRRAPIIGLCVCLCWILYDILYDQWPLLLPTAINIAVCFRNWKKMGDDYEVDRIELKK